MNRVNNRLKVCKALRRQADTSTDYNAVVACRSQVALHCLPGSSIRTDVADIALPSSVCHLLQRKRNTGAYLLNVHTAGKAALEKSTVSGRSLPTKLASSDLLLLNKPRRREVADHIRASAGFLIMLGMI